MFPLNLGLVTALLVIGGCSGFKYQPDNLAEEVAEEAIHSYTGADIDLSPGTPEKGFSPACIPPFKKDAAPAQP